MAADDFETHPIGTAERLAKLDAIEGAQTGEHVAELAGKYLNFNRGDLILAACDKDEAVELCADVRSMAASLLRQVRP